MWAITLTGMCLVYCCAASQFPSAMNLSISSLQMARAFGSWIDVPVAQICARERA